MTVAVLDTGIVPGYHDWLDARCDFGPGDVEPAESLATPEGRLRDEAGHGTFVAGVALQHAPGARVRVERVLNSDGYGTELEIAAAVLASRDADVINMSLAGYTAHDRPPRALGAALEALGTDPSPAVVVAAAGNAGTPRPAWPAAADGVISVGALDDDGGPAEFSNFGSWVDVWAEGVDILSSFLVFEETTSARRREGQTFTGHARWSGTSFAAPKVAAAIAALLAEEGTTNRRAAAETLIRSLPPLTLGRVLA
jgi:subtilisin family serine protease